MDAASIRGSTLDPILKSDTPHTGRLEAVACNLCGSERSQELYASNIDVRFSRAGRLCCTDSAFGLHGRIVRCRSCGLIFTSPREPQQAILDAYGAVEDPTYLQEEQGRVETFRDSLRLIRRFKRPPGSLVDIGCYTGLFLSLARGQGWTVAGVEPSRWACQVARQRYGVEVHPGTLSGPHPFTQAFDVASMWDALEHYTDPVGELEKTRELLRPGGLLVLTTIDIGSLIARMLGKQWWWMMEMHLYYFTRETVTAMLQRSGFDVLAIKPHVRIVSVRYLWTRLEPRLGTLARGLSRLGELTRMNRLCVPIVLGDIMTVVARRSS